MNASATSTPSTAAFRLAMSCWTCSSPFHSIGPTQTARLTAVPPVGCAW